MQKSLYARQVPAIVAEMEKEREQDNDQRAPAPDELDPTQQSEQPVLLLHRYNVEGGGVVLSSVELETDKEPETDQRPRTARQIPLFVYFLLILFIFVGLDNLDSVFASLAPIVTVTIQPVTKTISTTATFPLGAGGVQGRVLPALTLSQSQTVVATGKGHQDATYATGTLIFYNGSSTSQYVQGGSVFTGSDGVKVATDQSITVPPANLPAIGSIPVQASAVLSGSQGNIAAYDVNIALSPDLKVRNEASFQNGRDERHFTFVQSSDIQGVIRALTPGLLQSEQGALGGQLQPGENLTTPTCTPSVISNHHPNDEAASVEVTVSETCKAVAYSQQSLQQAAERLMQGKLSTLNAHYQQVGTIQVTVGIVSMQHSTPTLTATVHGVFVYQINERQIKAIVLGKKRLTALHMLSTVIGVQSASIAGVDDNSTLPTDPAHIHLVVFYLMQ